MWKTVKQRSVILWWFHTLLSCILTHQMHTTARQSSSIRRAWSLFRHLTGRNCSSCVPIAKTMLSRPLVASTCLLGHMLDEWYSWKDAWSMRSSSLIWLACYSVILSFHFTVCWTVFLSEKTVNGAFLSGSKWEVSKSFRRIFDSQRVRTFLDALY